MLVIGQDFSQHWQYALEHRFWDVAHSPRIRAGDDLVFWQAGAGLLGWAVATADPQALDSDTPRPWDDDRPYVRRIPFRLVSDDVISQIKWSRVQEYGQTRALASNGVVELKGPRQSEILSHFISFDMSWPDDQQQLELLDFPPHLDSRRRVARAIAVRRGQKAFRNALLTAYGEACAVTGCTIPDVLEAAHISPYRGDHTNDVRNGLLLRADIHTLFDLYRLTVGADDLVVRVHPALQSSEYAGYAGQRLRAGVTPSSVPDVGMLRQHNKECPWLSEVAAR